MRTSPRSWSAARLDYALAVSRSQQRAALGLYLPVGYPDRRSSRDALRIVAEHADIVELGVPHDACPMDGPAVRQAAAQSIAAGFEMRDLFTAAGDLTSRSTAAVLVMSYWTPIQRYGPKAFALELAAAGGAGVLIPDLPDDAASAWHEAAASADIHTVAMAPRHASNARLAALTQTTTGLLYSPATPGLTGGRRPLSPYLPRQVRRVRDATGLPVAVGIGISTPAQAAAASAYADAVVVGSALIRSMHNQPHAPASAADLTSRAFAAGVRNTRRPVTATP